MTSTTAHPTLTETVDYMDPFPPISSRRAAGRSEEIDRGSTTTFRSFLRFRRLGLILSGICSLLMLPGTFAAPPQNFALEPVMTGLTQPISLRFLPDGRMLLVQKKGPVRIVDVTVSPAVSQVYMNLNNVSDGLESDQERGVLDVAIDPNFSSSEPYIYLLYTPLVSSTGGAGRLRVSRFTHLEHAGAMTSRGNVNSEVVLWEDTQGYDSCCHYGGGLDFGPEGNLWITTGDHFQGSYAASLTKAGGGVHRIAKDGSIPPGNPYADGPGGNVDSLFAYGLRNPFRARWDIPSGRFFIAEVGGNTQDIAWEDLHVIDYDPAIGFLDSDTNGTYEGINFGWPTVEGLPPYDDFPAADIDPAGEPVFGYPHGGSTAAINGGVVYRGQQFPSEYVGAYFYADSTRDFVRYVKFNPDGSVAPNPNPEPISLTSPDPTSYTFDVEPTGRIVSLDVGPDGALYYVSFTDSGGAYGEPNPSVLGSVQRYVYSSGNVRPEIVEFSGVPVAQHALEVDFTIHATDPELDPMTYVLYYGDGINTAATPLPENTAVTVSHNYATDGVYEAVLEVSDSALVTRKTLPVAVGTPPLVDPISATNSRPNPPGDPVVGPNTTFRYGDTFTFTGSATDKNGTPISGDNFSWVISFVRPGNTHPAFGPTEGTSIQFPIPDQGQGFSGPVFYRVFLTVTDPTSSLQTTVEYDIFPEKSNITFESVPSGMVVQIDGNTEVQTPFVLDTLINYDHTITVIDLVCFGDSEYVFVDWSHGETTNQIIYNVPETDSALTANYALTGPCHAITPAESIRLFDGQQLNSVYPWFSESGYSDPSGVFTVQDGLLRVSGEKWGALVSDDLYRDYVMVLEFKWGDETWSPRETKAKDAGLLMHSRGADGGWNNLLMPGIQNQMLEGSMGDVILLKGADTNGATLPMSITSSIEQVTCTYSTWNCRGGYRWNDSGTVQTFSDELGSVHWFGWDPDWQDLLGFRGDLDLESPDGDWNQMVIVAFADVLEIYFNGVKVNEAFGVIPSEGRVQLESEFAEYFVRRWELLPLGAAVGAAITNDQLLNGVTGTPYSDYIHAVGGAAPLSWSVGSGLPAGLALNPATGHLSGTPSVSGDFSFTVAVTDADGVTRTEPFNLQILAGANLVTNGLVLQLEADENVSLLSGTTVEGWLDQSGMGNDVVATGNPQLVDGATPTGLPAIRLDGNDKLERLHASNPLGGMPAGNVDRTMLIVANYFANTAWAGASYGNGAKNEAFGLVAKQSSGELVLQGWGGNNDLVSAEPGVGAGWLVQSAKLESGIATLYRDGAGMIAQFNHNYATKLQKLVIGEEIAGFGHVSMDVAAVLVYDRALTPFERESVEMYLRNKYVETPPNAVPVVTISEPSDGAIFEETESITFAASAIDSEDGDVSDSIVWISDLDGVLGNGPLISVSGLSPGERLITAQVTDSGSPAQTGEDSITVTITEPAVGTVPFEADLALRLEATDGLSLSGSNVIGWSDLSGFQNNLAGSGSVVLLPNATPSGRPALALDGATGKLERVHATNPLSALPTANADRTMLVLARYHSTTWWAGTAYGKGAKNQAFGLAVKHPSGELVLQGWGTGNDFVSTESGVGAGWMVHSVVLGGGVAVMFKDGVSIGQFNHTYNTVLNKFVIGQEIANFGYVEMDVAAVLIYDRALSPTERASVEQYLINKYIAGTVNTAPVVAISQPADGASFESGVAIDFIASANDTEDGNLSASIAWTSDLDGALGTGSSLTLSTLSEGQHLITADTTDSGGLPGEDSLTLTITAPVVNTAPVVAISQPADGASFESGVAIDFVASADDTEDGDLSASVAWTSDRDGALGAGSSLTLSTLSEGQHLITADVADSGGLPGEDSITVTITAPAVNTAPVVAISQPTDGASFESGVAIDFVASADDTEDGDLSASIAWTSDLDGALGTGSSLTLSTLSEGQHLITADVADSGGLPGEDSITVTITAPAVNTAPVVAISQPADGTSFESGAAIDFVASADDTEDGNLSASIAWTSDRDGALGAGSSLTLSTLSEGQHLITADVADSGGLPGEDSITVTITAPAVNTAPVVAISQPADGTSFESGAAIDFVASADDTEDGNLSASIAWTSDRDGALGAGSSLTLSTLSEGQHLITADVADSGGLPGEDSITVTITAPAVGTVPFEADLALRLEATDGLSLSGSNVIGWSDLSGFQNNLAGSGSVVLLPNATPSGRPALALDGVTGKLERVHATNPLSALPTANADRTMLVLARYHSTTWWAGTAYGKGAKNQAFGLAVKHPSGELVLQGWGTGNDFVSTESGVGAGWMVHSVVLGGGVAVMFKDGVSIGQFNHTYNTVLNKFVIGQEIANFGYVEMDVAAVLIYDRALSPTERASAEQYLINKYIAGTVNTAPVVAISQPADGASFESGVSVNFIASANDTEDGNLSASVAWTSDRDGSLGAGSSLTLSTLSEGQHLITADVADSGGLPGEDSITVTITAASTVPFEADLALRLESTDGLSVSGSNVIGWSDLSAHGNNLTGTGGVTLLSTATPAGQPALALDGATGKLERVHATNPLSGLPTANADRTMLVLARYHSTTWWAGTAYGKGAKNQAFGLIVKHPSGELVLQGWGTGNDFVSTESGVGGEWMVHSVVLGGGVAVMFKDGVSIGQFNHTYNTVLNKFVIGQEIANFGYVEMDVAAVLIYDRALSSTERASVEQYLINKYIVANG